MRETALRIRTFDKIKKKFVGNPLIKYDSPQIIYCEHSPTEIITHYSGVNDSKGNLIYQGDIVKLSGKENDEEYIGIVFMERKGLNNKEFILKPAWKIVKSENPEISSDTEYFISIETPTNGENRIRGHFLSNDYPINKENGTGFSDGTISEVVGNVFENENLIFPYYIEFTRNNINPFFVRGEK